MKVEIFLRLANIPHVVNSGAPPGPNGSWPYATLLDGTVVCDSQRILDVLTERYEVCLDAGLTEAQRGTATLLRRLCEDHLYFCQLRHALVDNKTWSHRTSTINVPDKLLGLLYSYLRKESIKRINATNVGDMSDAEYHRAMVANLKAIASVIDTNDARNDGRLTFILGTTKPTTADCVVYAYLIHFAKTLEDRSSALHCPATEFFAQHEGLQEYVQRMTDIVYPDLDDLVSSTRDMPLRDVAGAVTVKQLIVAGVTLSVGAAALAWSTLRAA